MPVASIVWIRIWQAHLWQIRVCVEQQVRVGRVTFLCSDLKGAELYQPGFGILDSRENAGLGIAASVY